MSSPSLERTAYEDPYAELMTRTTTRRLGKDSVRRNRAAQGVLALAVGIWVFSLLSIFTIGVFVAPTAIPFFVVGVAVWPSKVHVAIGAAGTVWGIGALIVLVVVAL